MANEWVEVELFGANGDGGKRRVTIADGVNVSKGTLLQLLDPRTASYSHLGGVPVAGVAAEEHIANKGVTEISVWTDGIFEVKASGSIGLGSWVEPGVVANTVREFIPSVASSALIVAASLAAVLGYSMETASDTEVINVRLRL